MCVRTVVFVQDSHHPHPLVREGIQFLAFRTRNYARRMWNRGEDVTRRTSFRGFDSTGSAGAKQMARGHASSFVGVADKNIECKLKGSN
jgi:hypothetical protein